MKKKRYLTVCAIALSVLLLFSGCAAVLQNLENKEIRQTTETMLDALIANDPQTAYSMVSHFCTDADFKPIFAEMQELLGDANTYELKLLYIQAHTSHSNRESVNTVNSIYELTTAVSKLIVNVQMNSQNQLTRFYLTPYEYTDYYFTGTLQTMGNANGAQWIVLFLNVIALGLMIFALVDCCRQKINKKALWILLLIFGVLSFGVTMSTTGFRLNFTYGWITAYSALIRYGSGTIVLRLMLPVSAIAYLAMRRSLINKNQVTSDLIEEESEITAEEDTPLQDTTEDSV